ncbi:MAG: ABC transporter permease subunit [Pseudomonadota bacterium]
MSWSLLRPIARRLLHSIFTLWLATVLFFVVIEFMPGDFAIATATQSTSQAMIEATRHELGLYDSAPARYFRWLGNALTGDLGTSWWVRQPIAPLVADRLSHSAWLFFWAVLVTVPLGLLLAFISASKPHSPLDRALSVSTLSIMSVPEFIVAYAVMFILAVQLDLFPSHTHFALEMSWWERLYATTLPILSLIAVTVTPIFRLTRAAMLSTLETEYIQLAEIKGVDRRTILLRHAFPNAIAPVANAVALSMGNLIFGLVIIEIVYSYPGIGKLMVTAAGFQDVPLVQACALVCAIIYLALIAAADVITIVSNPRLRYPATDNRLTLAFPGLRWLPRSWNWKALGVAAGTTAAAAGLAVWFWPVLPQRPEVTVSPPSTGARDRLTLPVLLGREPGADGIVHHAYFERWEPFEPARHSFEGELDVPEFTASYRRAWASSGNARFQFPGFKVRLVTHGDALLPIERDMLLPGQPDTWRIILSAGRIWHEPRDGQWSRAAFPFTIIRTAGYAPHYGVAAFAFDGQRISQVRFQIAQETANWAQADVWGQTPARFEPGEVPGAQAARSAWDRRMASRLDVRPWSELAAKYWSSLEGFDGEGNRHNISASGLYVDDTVYLRGCRTRAGPHPFCREMRHGVFSVTKSMGAGVAMLWLAQKYGPDVFNKRVVDFIRIPAGHNGWEQVTFGHLLDMVTGIGNVTPQRVSTYVDVENTAINSMAWRARSMQDKLEAVARYASYPWGPGEVFRYRSPDTMVLAAAMQAFVKAQEGPEADLWDMLTEEVFAPMGIDRLPVNRTLEPDGRRGTVVLASGLFPTIEEAFKIARLLQDHGAYKGRQLLHRELTKLAVSNDMDRGYVNGWTTSEGGVGRYHMSFWLHPHIRWFGCDTRVPTMSGYGGNYISIMPNRTIGLRFADGHDDDRYTWDSSGIRNVSSRIRSFC